MPKQSNFKWQPDEYKELERAVKNFNAKISRLEKKDPKKTAPLPERISLKELRNSIENRHDLKREVNSLKRFTERGAEELVKLPGANKYNLEITKWQKDDMQRRVKNINRKRERRRETIANIEMTSRGQSLGYNKGDFGMGKIGDLELKPTAAFTNSMSYTDLRKKQRSLRKESTTEYWNIKDRIMKENYIDSLVKNFNPADIEDIVEKIDNMSFAEFRKIFEAEGGNFELSYPGDNEQYKESLTALKSIWVPNKAPQKRRKGAK